MNTFGKCSLFQYYFEDFYSCHLTLLRVPLQSTMWEALTVCKGTLSKLEAKNENLRNEIIHTKQSNSEKRYSKLLSRNIFDIVKNHKKVIHYYGEHVSKYRTELLEEYPYEFGYNDIIPGLMTDKNYWKSYKSIHNINFDKTDEEE